MANQITPNPSVPSQVVAEVKFPKFINNLGIIPTSYKDSMNYYETLAWLCKYLEQTVIPTVNQNGEAVEELQNLYIELNSYVDNYFVNLDVQEEINNKLDSLVENGTLTNIIKNYIDPLINSFENEINDVINQQNNAISNINTKVNASVGINPLLADSISEMTDTSRIYVLSSDGNWYFYNGSEWTAGGIYQATEYGENTIPSKSINNVVYNKINNNIKLNTFTSSNFTNLNNVTVTEDTDSFTFRVTSRSSNAQFRMNFNFDEIQNNMHILLNISNLRFIPYMNLSTSSNKTVDDKIIKNGESIINLEAEDVKSTTSIVVSLYTGNYTGIVNGDILLTIDKNYYTSTSDFYDYFNNNNLSNYLNDLTKYSGIKNRNELIDINQAYGNNINQIIRSDNNYSCTINIKDRGIQSLKKYITSSKLYIKGEIPLDSNSINLYFVAYDGNNTPHYNNTVFQAGDKIELIFDLAYYSVYQNMESFNIIINSGTIGTFKINNLEVYIDELSDLEIYSNNLKDTLINIQNKFSDIESTISQQMMTLKSPNNTEYKIVVDNNGNLSTIPISSTISKALFIGNSLLLGFGTHGMASYSINDDYYYYVTNYLINKNNNFTSTKISGTYWEASINANTTNNYINNILNNYMTQDTDTVFIQLGDNCNTSDKINFIPTKGQMLINAIKSINPNVKIYWIASWYNSTAKQNYLVELCNTYGIKYINIAPLSTPENQAYLGYEYIDSNGVTQTITNSGVAAHPSSKGMKAISDLIIENL